MNLFTKYKQIHIEALDSDTFCVWSMLCSSFMAAKEKRAGDGCGVSDQQMQAIIYTMDKQECPIVQHKEIYSISCDKL